MEAVIYMENGQLQKENLYIDLAIQMKSYRQGFYDKYLEGNIFIMKDYEVKTFIVPLLNGAYPENYRSSLEYLAKVYSSILILGNNMLAEQILEECGASFFCTNFDKNKFNIEGFKPDIAIAFKKMK